MEDKEKIINAIEIYNKGEQLEAEDKFEEAFKAYEEAAKLNYNKALFKVGHFYRFGLGVDKDLIKAMNYFQKAVKSGNVDAMQNIGIMYYSGEGVEKSYEEAKIWFKKAAKLGDKFSCNRLGNMYFYGTGMEPDYVKALKEQGSQNLMIWPYHCLHCTDGWLIDKQLSNMLLFFEMSKKISVRKILKGQDSFTEMYGVIRAEVITESNKKYDDSWVYEIKNADEIYVCGEAKDYCVYESVKQFCEVYSNDKNTTEKVNVMMNCSSAIGDNNVCEQKYHELSKKYGIKLINI